MCMARLSLRVCQSQRRTDASLVTLDGLLSLNSVRAAGTLERRSRKKRRRFADSRRR
jgi:hypothetical protein